MEWPEGYIDVMQSDSDSVNDPLYTQEKQNAPASPASPPLSGGISTAYRKRQREKKAQGRQDSFDAANKLLTDRRNRITTPTREEDDDEISRPATEPKKSRRYQRNKPSIVWEHVTKSGDDRVQCKHCNVSWVHLSGSTSTPLKHVKDQHYNKLTDEQKQRMPRSNPAVNPKFGVFCEEILTGRYNVPTRGYMLDNVLNPMFHETKEQIKMKLKNRKNIGLTTDAWTSIAQKSFITITAHIIDEDFKLVSYVLDTQEIKKNIQVKISCSIIIYKVTNCTQTV